MKKFTVLLMALVLAQSAILAKDYAKLQIKEMQHAQKYNTTQKYFDNTPAVSNQQTTVKNSLIKDPGLMVFGEYTEVSDKDYNKKLKADESEYAQIQKEFSQRTVDNYNAQAVGEDYYKLYRVAERIIRANKLDYQTWRIGVYRDTEQPNAFSSNNLIAISTALYDTFRDNDDALAMVLGHEMGHALLGHQQRSAQQIGKMERNARAASWGNEYAALGLAIRYRKYLADSKNMEYAADIEGAKLAAKAGYDLSKSADVISYLETLGHDSDHYSDHPDPAKRKENLRQNMQYFVDKYWAKEGKSNIYNSDVLKVTRSSDRKSIVIDGNPRKRNSNDFYRPETPAQIYSRYAYKSYVNGQFTKAIEYFDKLFALDSSNAPAYLYASYASEALYRNLGKEKYLEDAKEYAQKAKSIEPNNKYIIEQVNSL